MQRFALLLPYKTPSNDLLSPIVALLVSGSLPLEPSDKAIFDRLTELGFTVETKLAPMTNATDASGKQLVIISETVKSSDLQDRLKSVPVGVLVMDPVVWSAMGMTGAAWGSQIGDIPDGRSVTIVPSSSELVGGLSGTISTNSVATKYEWGEPSPSALIGARLSPTGKPGLFAYEAGASMVAGTAAARRVGHFAGGMAASSFTPDGWTLFDAAALWAAKPGAILVVDNDSVASSSDQRSA